MVLTETAAPQAAGHGQGDQIRDEATLLVASAPSSPDSPRASDTSQAALGTSNPLGGSRNLEIVFPPEYSFPDRVDWQHHPTPASQGIPLDVGAGFNRPFESLPRLSIPQTRGSLRAWPYKPISGTEILELLKVQDRSMRIYVSMDGETAFSATVSLQVRPKCMPRSNNAEPIYVLRVSLDDGALRSTRKSYEPSKLSEEFPFTYVYCAERARDTLPVECFSRTMNTDGSVFAPERYRNLEETIARHYEAILGYFTKHNSLRGLKIAGIAPRPLTILEEILLERKRCM